MATEDEARGLVHLLARLKRPESPWILESRRLSLSQVSLYFGGWCLLIALTVGVWHSEAAFADLWAPLGWLMPLGLVLSIGALGVALQRRGEWRVAFGFLLTTSLAIPAAVWNSLRVSGWLSAAESAQDRQVFPSAQLGLANDQMLVIATAWLAASVVFRIQLPSAAFAFLGSLAILVTWATAWVKLFFVEDASRLDAGYLAAWSLCATGGLVGLAWWRDATEARTSGESLWRSRVADAGAILSVGLVGLIASLSAISWWAPELAWLGQPRVGSDGTGLARPSVEARAAAFLIDGGVLLALSVLLSVRGTSLRNRAARALRWIVPSFILLPSLGLSMRTGRPVGEPGLPPSGLARW